MSQTATITATTIVANSPPNFYEVDSPEHFQSLLSADLQRISLINFWAPWAAPCKQMNEVVFELAKKYPQVLVLQVEAESQSDIVESFEIEAVPSFLVLRGHTLLGRIAGADAAGLANTLAQHVAPPVILSAPTEPPSAQKSETTEELNARLRRLMSSAKVMLFMKGIPDAPRCGFSRRMVQLLRDQNTEFSSFDILSDESVRSGLKVLNNWPTFPQLIANGEFVGGLDIVTEMVENGEYQDIVGKGQ